MYQLVLLILLYMTGVFFLAVLLKDNSIVDIAWGIGFILIATSQYPFGEFDLRMLVLFTLVALWGVRLAAYIALRKIGKGEDWRYAAWRQQWGKWLYGRSYVQIFLLQGCIMLIISLPIITILRADAIPLTMYDLPAIALWLTGFLCETIADAQMYVFKQNTKNKGRVLATGLWRYSRHPNYFGEMLIWWAVFGLAIPVQDGWLTIWSPVLMTLLLLKVSGVVLLEKKYEGSAEYEEYKRKTSTFIPLPPKA